jgi:hypothetical protein
MSQISVIGGEEAGDSDIDRAREVGRLLGQEGVTVICGGGGGVMEAVAAGVSDAENGRVIGIRPEEHDRNANRFLDDVIVTGVGYARNIAVVLSGEAVIAVGGQFGTLSEIAFSKKFEKPIFGIGTWDHEDLSFPSDLLPEEAVRRALAAVEQ